jgi:MFS family permease
VAEKTAFDDRTESGASSGTRLGRVRWTICAMLFVATSINYMDRQVIAILKPTLEHSIGLTEVNYGYIVDAFQIAYAIGLLAAGRLIDRLGTRIGYMLVMAVWSLSAMGHALASTANPATFPPRSRLLRNGSRRVNAHLPLASSIQERTSVRSWLL